MRARRLFTYYSSCLATCAPHRPLTAKKQFMIQAVKNSNVFWLTNTSQNQSINARKIDYDLRSKSNNQSKDNRIESSKPFQSINQSNTDLFGQRTTNRPSLGRAQPPHPKLGIPKLALLVRILFPCTAWERGTNHTATKYQERLQHSNAHPPQMHVKN